MDVVTISIDMIMCQVSCVSDGARPAVKFSWKLGEDQYSGLVTDPGLQFQQVSILRLVVR